jgi:hypothetical protein
LASAESNARDFRRYSVQSERADGVVSFDGLEHDAVIADTSATGFGLLMMRGVHLEVGQTVRLMANDALHECEVAYIQPEEAFLHVGVKRLSDTPMVELKVFHMGRALYKPKAGGMSFLIFIGVIVGFSGMFISVATVMGFKRNNEGFGPTVNSTETHNGGSRAQSGVSLKERIEQQKKRALLGSRQLEQAGDSLSSDLRRQQAAIRKLVNGSSLSWDKLSETLGLSSSQQRQLLDVLNSGSDRESALDILSADQRRKLDQM